MAAGRRKKADTELILALACGATPENAAQKAGISRRTVFRRLAQPHFREQVHQVRADMVRRTMGILTAAGMASIKTLTFLQESAGLESVRLGAARTIIELGCKLRETVEVADRLDALEEHLESLTGARDPPTSDPINAPKREANENKP